MTDEERATLRVTLLVGMQIKSLFLPIPIMLVFTLMGSRGNSEEPKFECSLHFTFHIRAFISNQLATIGFCYATE